MASVAINVASLNKSFGTTKAVRNVSLQVNRGEVFGLLGPNGSGKSTMMKLILGLLKPDSGSIDILGVNVLEDALEAKRIIGYVPEEPRLYEFLTGVEYLDFIADVYVLPLDVKKKRITEFLNAFQLEGRENDMISGYSHGMKQKIAIIAALLHRPKLLVLDEPLSGLDPRSARILKDLIHGMSEEGVTTLFSTHVMEIADAMCDRVAIISQGEVLSRGTVTELRKEADMPGSSLEDVFLKVTGESGIEEVIEALVK